MIQTHEIYKKFLPKDAIVYDIGAHIGEISKVFIDYGAKHVYAFEPSDNNFSLLLNNTKHLSNITCFKLALHSDNYRCKTPFKDCRTDYVDGNGNRVDTEQNIEYINLKDFIQKENIPQPDYIKLDIEGGMESIVLNTFTFLWNQQRPTVYVEIHAAPRSQTAQRYKDNPHWTWPEDGGFNFNDFKKYDYTIIHKNKALSVNNDYNPFEGMHDEYVLIPTEKMNLL